MGFFGILLIAALALIFVLGLAGLIIFLVSRKKGEPETPTKSVTENVADLNDQFNRARYQDRDGE
ncbi:MAG: hypothetical protein K6F68_04425 [Clostridiales bacterium]|nr:hypothetical protein [Clostridiales bacterium]